MLHKQSLRSRFCDTPHKAFWWAVYVDERPSDMTREVASKDPLIAYWYARQVDKGPCSITRDGACMEPGIAFLYARDIDKCKTPETRAAVSNDLYWARKYELEIPPRTSPKTIVFFRSLELRDRVMKALKHLGKHVMPMSRVRGNTYLKYGLSSTSADELFVKAVENLLERGYRANSITHSDVQKEVASIEQQLVEGE